MSLRPSDICRLRPIARLTAVSSGLFLLVAFSLWPWAGAASDAAQQPPGAARKPSPAPAQDELPVIRVMTRLVQVSVIVTDKQGKPIRDLKAEDFTLKDGGNLQTISVFSAEERGGSQYDSTPLPPDTYSNRLARKTGEPNAITVILLDGINTHISDQSYARSQILRFLGQIDASDPVALMTMTSREVRVLHGPTRQRRSLIENLQKYKGENSAALEASTTSPADTGLAELNAFLDEGNERVADFFLQTRAYNTVSALKAVAGYLARFPGRKNLIWVSGAFPISFGYDRGQRPFRMSPERQSFYSNVEGAAKAISNANVAVYPVDARGLMTDASALGSSIDTMNLLASRTGGRAFYNRNDIDTAVKTVVADSQVTYLLGYYPTHGKWNGNFREIRVKVNRPGVVVRTRAGYFAGAEPMQDEPTRQALLRDAAASPLDAGGIGLTVTVHNVTGPAAERAVELQITAEHEGVTLQPEADRWRGEVDVLVAQQRANGTFADWQIQTVQMKLRSATMSAIQREGLRLSKTVMLNRETHALRIAVRDVPSGAIGTVTVPLPSR